jgi:hypothetical protein
MSVEAEMVVVEGLVEVGAWRGDEELGMRSRGAAGLRHVQGTVPNTAALSTAVTRLEAGRSVWW